MLFDWVNYDTDRLTTLAENVIRMFAVDLGVSDYNVSYYDFRYPEATNLFLVAERLDEERIRDFFEITISRGPTIYEVSWSLAQFSSVHGGSFCRLNEETLGQIHAPYSKWYIATDELSKTKLPFETTHRLSAWFNVPSAAQVYCGIAIVYQEVER